jgi:aryl-alcohol dehydrogenase-like predicted oxidoreductase
MKTMIRIPNTDLDVFRLNLGANTFGWTSDRDTSIAVLDAYAAAGGNFIDTADQYSFWQPGNEGGESETIIGNWLTARGNRDRIVIATKFGGLPTRKGLSVENADAALGDSLRRLQTDYIDLYYLHYDDDAVSIEDQVQMGHGLVQSGRVRHLGLSNFTPERMRAWFEVATREGLTVPVAIQPEYNLVHRRQYERDYAPIAREFDVAVFPYYALAAGFLTGKYRTEADLAGQARGGFVAAHLNTDGLAVVDALVEVADAHSVEPATIALAWLLAKGVTAPIASARTPEQLPSLLAAVDLALTDAEVAKLDAASEPFA